MTPGHVLFQNGSLVRIEIVESPTEMEKGLSGRKELPENEGMLFWMGLRSDHGFWMKGTYIPLDLLFIDHDMVVGILTLLPFDARIRKCGRPSTCVLEVNAGWAARHGIVVGSKVTISLE